MLSLSLWTFVSFTQNPTEVRPFSVPVDVVPPPEGLIAVNPETELPLRGELTTEIDASVATVDASTIRDTNFRATLNLNEYGEGDHLVPITVTPPTGVRVRRQQPTTLNVRIVQQATREFSVEKENRNRPAFLFEPGDVTLPLKQVTATGPRNLLERVQRVIVPINLEGRTATFTDEVVLEAVDANGAVVQGITIIPERTRVTVPIAPRANVQRVSVLPRFIGQPAPGYTTEGENQRIDWNPKYVDLIAPVEITGTLETEPITLTGRTEPFTQTVQLADLDDPSITLLTPSTITVTVPIAPFQTPSLGPVFVPVSIVNLGPDLQETHQPLGFTITARGTADQFKQLETQPVQAIVDVRGLGPGTYPLAAVVELPSGLQIVSGQPQVTVTITAVAPTPTASSPPGG
jgi:YbbR domain-containing protein